MSGDGAGQHPGSGGPDGPKPSVKPDPQSGNPSKEPTESSLSPPSASPADKVNWKCKSCNTEIPGISADFFFPNCPYCKEPQGQGTSQPDKTSAENDTKLHIGTPANTDFQSNTKGKANLTIINDYSLHLYVYWLPVMQ